jgi:hypothetical protein
VKVEGLLFQRVHIVEDSNNQRLFEDLLQGVRARIHLGRLEFASKRSGGITPLNTSKEDGDRNTSKGDEIRKHLIKDKIRRENIDSSRRSH